MARGEGDWRKLAIPGVSAKISHELLQYSTPSSPVRLHRLPISDLKVDIVVVNYVAIATSTTGRCLVILVKFWQKAFLPYIDKLILTFAAARTNQACSSSA